MTLVSGGFQIKVNRLRKAKKKNKMNAELDLEVSEMTQLLFISVLLI
jgi:hypothetical protein